MLPGSHLIRITYGPGFAGSPNSTACSFVPAAFLTHLMSPGGVKSTAVRSRSAAPAGATVRMATIARVSRAHTPVMFPLPIGRVTAAPLPEARSDLPGVEANRGEHALERNAPGRSLRASGS